MYIALVDASMFVNAVMTEYTCTLHLPDLLAYTLSGETNSYSRTRNLYAMWNSGLLQGGFLW